MSRFAGITEAGAREELERLREAIDNVDEVLVKLLNQRAKYAVEVGEIKAVLAQPVYVPEREKQVLAHVESASAGPLDSGAVRRLFERIIDESRRVERLSGAASSEQRATSLEPRATSHEPRTASRRTDDGKATEGKSSDD